jgi:signal transduction histidine kinase
MIDEIAPLGILTSEREVLAHYERARQLRLAQSAAPLLAVLMGGFAASILLFARFSLAIDRLTLILAAGFVALGALGTIAAGLLAQRARGRAAADTIASAVGLALLAVAYTWVQRQGLDPFALVYLALLALFITLTGLLTTIPGTIAATIGTNLITVIIIAQGLTNPHTDTLFRRGASLYVILLILLQWACAGLVLAVRRNYQTTFQELSRLYTQAKQVDEIKDQFITSVNHELRNPIMALTGYIEILQLRQGQMTDERRGEILGQAGKVGDRVAHLLESILDARRLDQGAEDFTPAVVNLKATVEAAAQLIDPREGSLEGRELRVDVPDDLAIWGDEVRLQQVLTNLISNAVKYSAAGTPIDVSAHVITEPLPMPYVWPRGATNDHRMVEIVVRDHGLGIPPEQAGLLFRRFVRLPRDLASTTIGNGLGLHLCKIFVGAMRGKIWIESSGQEGDGTAFHFTLPLPPAEYMLADQPSAREAAAE